AYWFGEDYPAFSPIYERNANSSLVNKMDSTFAPPPDGGWLSVLESGQYATELENFIEWQMNVWAVTGAATADLVESLGSRPKVSYDAAAAVALLASNASLEALAFPNYTSGAGLVSGVGQRLFVNVTAAATSASFADTFRGLVAVPYFEPTAGGGATTAEALDDDMAARLRVLIQQLATLNKT
ncbi:hypothetical protein HK405_012989, partial [Cladochytrium tenue]